MTRCISLIIAVVVGLLLVACQQTSQMSPQVMWHLSPQGLKVEVKNASPGEVVRLGVSPRVEICCIAGGFPLLFFDEKIVDQSGNATLEVDWSSVGKDVCGGEAGVALLTRTPGGLVQKWQHDFTWGKCP